MCFLCLLIIQGRLHGLFLTALLSFLVLINFIFKVEKFTQVLFKMRWLFISMLFIYAFGTPGELLKGFPSSFAPTYEGLSFGLAQLERLVIALAALTLLVTGIPRDEMILGLYTLLKPLKWLGFNIEKFSVRLMLTLQYVEELAQHGREQFNLYALDKVQQEVLIIDRSIVLPHKAWSMLDKCVLSMLAVILGLSFTWRLA